MLAGGLGAAYLIEHRPIIAGLVYVCIGVSVFGAILIDPDPLVGTAKNIVVVILPLVPWGRRPSGTVTPPPDDKG